MQWEDNAGAHGDIEARTEWQMVTTMKLCKPDMLSVPHGASRQRQDWQREQHEASQAVDEHVEEEVDGTRFCGVRFECGGK